MIDTITMLVMPQVVTEFDSGDSDGAYRFEVASGRRSLDQRNVERSPVTFLTLSNAHAFLEGHLILESAGKKSMGLEFPSKFRTTSLL